MYIQEACSDEAREEILKFLKYLGVKHKNKRSERKTQAEDKVELYHVFKTSLEHLEKELVTLEQSSIPIAIPVFVIDTCKFIQGHMQTVGLFRKAGSLSKQRDLRALLDSGSRLEVDGDHNVISVANLLKLFLRELPDPLIPFKFHDIFIQSLNLEANNVEAILSSCLLLPLDHINTLAFFLKFLRDVSLKSTENKMDANNLAIIFTPCIMPVNTPRLTTTGLDSINQRVKIVQILIENAASVGVVPEVVKNKLTVCAKPSQDDQTNDSSIRVKKRRSGSLTRVFQGIKKMISSKHSPENVKTSDFKSHTPKIVERKRKPEHSCASNKKRKESLNLLPDGILVGTPRIKSVCRTMLTPKTMLTKRTINSKTPLKQIPLNEDSLVIEKQNESWPQIPNKSPNEPSTSQEYVCLPRREYEAIKKRVSEIETQIECDMDQLINKNLSQAPQLCSDVTIEGTNDFDSVEVEFKKIMKETEKIGDLSAESLSNQFNRDLIIKRHSDQGHIRSPSARKIGSIRRRSKDFNAPKEVKSALDRPSAISSTRMLKRGKPNTVYTGLPHPISCMGDSACYTKSTASQVKSVTTTTNFETPDSRKNMKIENKWVDAHEYLIKSPGVNSEGGRESIIKLRNQNLGNVLAQTKMFESITNTKNRSEQPLKPSNSHLAKSHTLVKIKSESKYSVEGEGITNMYKSRRSLPSMEDRTPLSPIKNRLVNKRVGSASNFKEGNIRRRFTLNETTPRRSPRLLKRNENS